MRRLCERPGCSSPAEVSYGIDKSRLLVWVDSRAPSERELTGRLCKRHADSLVVPRGWSLDDRREPVPLLFPAARLVDSSGGTERPDAPDSSKSMRRPRSESQGNVLPLFDSVRTDQDGPAAPEPVVSAPETKDEPDRRYAAGYDNGDYDTGDNDFGDNDFGDNDFGDSDFGDSDFGDNVNRLIEERIDHEDEYDRFAGEPFNDERVDSWDADDEGRQPPGDNTSWLQRLAPLEDLSEAAMEDEEPTLGRLMGRAFGRARPADGRG